MTTEIKERIVKYSKELRLPTFRGEFEVHASEAAKQEASYEEYLLGLMEKEYYTRVENRKKSQIRQAGFPQKHYLHDLQKELLPDNARQKLPLLERLDFIKEGRNVVLAGNPGTGKTHIDLLAIEGMSYSTVLALMSEVGIEGIKKFKTAKHFTSWLRLAPNNKVSGGKVLSSKVPKGSNRLKIALRNAANAIGNLKESTPLRDFFQRISFRKGRVSAISATARKLAVIIWNMIVKGVPYVNPAGYLFLDQKRKLGLVKRIRKQIDKFGLTNEDIGIITS
jgi:hypothetical protein